MRRRSDIDGQMDLFDILRSYTDDVGATVIVGDPKELLEESYEELKANSNKAEKPVRERKLKVIDGTNDKSSKDSEKESDGGPQLDLIQDIMMESGFNLVQNVEPESNFIQEITVDPVLTHKLIAEPTKEIAEPTKEIAEPTKKIAEPTKGIEEPIKEIAEPTKEISKPTKKSSKPRMVDREPMFKQCKKCWCFDCMHNVMNEGKPRNMCGTMMACPACKGCEESGNPEICEIGSAKEGCMTRAIEEGIVVPETME